MSELLPSVKRELDLLATFYRTEVAIHELNGQCPQDSLYHPVIWILSPSDRHNKELVKEATREINERWVGLNPKFVSHNFTSGYPPLVAGSYHQLWIFFFADRVDTQSELFIRWADEHRESLREIPPVLVKWYSKQQLSSVDASIFEGNDIDEVVAEYKCLILPLETPDELFKSIDREDVLSFLGVLVLQAYRAVAPHAYKSRWQYTISGLLDDLRTSMKKSLPINSSLETALHTVFNGYRTMKNWDDICEKVEEIEFLPECEPGTAWDKKMHDSIIESAEISRDRIYRKRSQTNTTAGKSNERKYSSAFAEFQKLSDKLIELSVELATELDKREDTVKASQIRELVTEASSSIQIILYGPFSSGKTTFVNTLLNFKGDIVLPVKGTPTTSTFNLISYGEKESFEPLFNSSLESMTLITSEPGKRRSRVHREEMEALLSWIDDNMLKDMNLTIKLLRPSKARAQHEDANIIFHEKKIERLHLDAIKEVVAQKCDFIDTEIVSNNSIPVSISGIYFKKHYLVNSFDDLDCLGSKAALMINKINIQRKHQQLRHLNIVDTPGVDSCIPYHHTMARSYIEGHNNSPIIYFIDGKRAGGNTDKKNIEHLLNLNEKQDSHLNLQKRTFFLITKRDEIEQDDRAEVLDKIQDVIKNRGWNNPAIYLVDSVFAAGNPDDNDWVNFSSAVQCFLKKHQVTYLKGITDTFRKTIESWIVEENKKLEELDNSIDARQKKSGLRTQFIACLNNFMASDFSKRSKDILENKSLYMNGSKSLDDAIDDAKNGLRNVDSSAWLESTKNELVSEMEDVIDDLTNSKIDWKNVITKNIEKLANDLSARINKFIIETSEKLEFMPIRDDILRCKPDITSPVKQNFVPILWEHHVIKARNSSDDIDSNWAGWYTDDIKSYRSRIISALEKTLLESQTKIDTEFKRICDGYKEQIKRSISTLDELSRTTLSDDGEKVRKKVGSDKDFYEKWNRQVMGAFPV